MGDQSSWIPDCRVLTRSCTILYLWREDTEDEQVRSHVNKSSDLAWA